MKVIKDAIVRDGTMNVYCKTIKSEKNLTLEEELITLYRQVKEFVGTDIEKIKFHFELGYRNN